MNNGSASIVELFSSIQGEGVLVGLRQAFLRFHGCNLACEYCDTRSDEPPEEALLEETPGRQDFLRERNPVPLERVARLLQLWESALPGIHHSLSITGGEPLINHRCLQEWLPELRAILPVYLETNGILHHALSEVIPHLDYISMDIKLPSSSGCTGLWEEHRRFLKIAARTTVFVKAVVSAETEDWEILRTAEMIAEVNPRITCILQPVTRADGTPGIAPIRALEMQEMAGRCLTDVRVIPQTHKFMGQL
ncbi:7-carboxy-7-deazaguanine synthase QueE [Geobacter sp. DSM 9736]|uniref:7-carboxy-7-deazaguanine synthase QueE n=1 Tax=Geobacter sp. DSM 9736 TaxID=1277350 RepID=UPI000B50F0C1|nr:7-carboxy-7-deazaguanine synthase QueE [Geobacter sp. DSM 9736]SNB45631.1 Organic radical activating enzyme [Geobacter sp. DSM 9736]